MGRSRSLRVTFVRAHGHGFYKWKAHRIISVKVYQVISVEIVMSLVLDHNLENEEDISLRILVVDDDELSRRLMRVILTHEGHRVEVAANGLEALEAVKHNKFDIVFMDLHMPDMDGIESSRQIRAWENEDSHTFIVALTASYLPEVGQILFDAGMDNYISKPFEVEQIQRLLKYSLPASH
jgi:CheY-like chemotaxis protein